MRRSSKKSVVDGTRSGSGGLIIENWDQLVSIWGGCPSVKQIQGVVMSRPNDDIMDRKWNMT